MIINKLHLYLILLVFEIIPKMKKLYFEIFETLDNEKKEINCVNKQLFSTFYLLFAGNLDIDS